MTKFVRLTATGQAVTGNALLKSAVLQGGSANSTANVKDSSDGSGADIFSIAAVIGASASWTSSDSEGVYFSKGIHATLAGAGAALTLEVEV